MQVAWKRYRKFYLPAHRTAAYTAHHVVSTPKDAFKILKAYEMKNGVIKDRASISS